MKNFGGGLIFIHTSPFGKLTVSLFIKFVAHSFAETKDAGRGKNNSSKEKNRVFKSMQREKT